MAGTVIAALGVAGLLIRRRSSGDNGATLREDDARVLRFLSENGGKAMEFEIRTKFALPKTSAWRQIKRLERMGYVRVTKVGSQNQVELLRNA